MAMAEQVVSEALKQEIGTISGTLQRFFSTVDELDDEDAKYAAVAALNNDIALNLPGTQIVFPEGWTRYGVQGDGVTKH